MVYILGSVGKCMYTESWVSCPLHLHFLRQGLSLNLKVTDWTGWLASELHRSGVAGVYYCARDGFWGLNSGSHACSWVLQKNDPTSPDPTVLVLVRPFLKEKKNAGMKMAQ